MSQFNFNKSMVINACIVAVLMILTQTHAIVLATGAVHILGTFLLWSSGTVCMALIERSIRTRRV